MTATRHFRIIGQVQGVGYRAAAQRAAAGLGLRGWVRNRDDGSVEVVAAGPDDALGQLRDWLAHGPAAASVTDVEQRDETPADLPESFAIR